jgi:nicotinamidase-related amidase
MTQSVLVVIDVQTALFPKMQDQQRLLAKLMLMVEAASLFKIPIIVSEQYPEKLGSTIPELHEKLHSYPHFHKRSFSCLQEPLLKEALSSSKTAILIGIETHICVLETAKELVLAGKQVVVVLDATSSRYREDKEIAAHELRQLGARVTTAETLVFEMMGDSRSFAFKALLEHFK